MSHLERKVLVAKRNGDRPSNRPRNSHTTTFNNSDNHGSKRGNDSEEIEQPPRKRPNRNHFQESYSSTPKNLAERRLQNLRKNLETQRRQSDGNSNESPSAFATKSVQTLSTSISNESSYTEQQEEEMDWTEIDEIAVVKDINDIRKEINYNKELPEAITVENNVSLDTEGVFVVCDTNIFISHLNLLDQLREKNFPDFGQVTIYIPWMVMQELDHMKESHSAPNRQSMARRANNYINSRLASKDPHFTGQLAKDYAKIEMSSKNQDDGILFSCLQLAEKRKFVILLSNDTNLRNKALVNQIPAYSSSEIINSLSNLKTEQENEKLYVQAVQKIKILLSNLLTHIIQCEMKEAYGNVWDKMALMKPPFTTEEALNCLVKYWLAVFSFSLQKQCKTKLDEFVMFLRSNKNVSIYQESDFQKFVEHSLNLCIYLKNGYRNKYPDLISDCLNNIQQCADI